MKKILFGLLAVTVQHREFHGWKDAIVLRNAAAMVTVVPSIGRVVQFGYLDTPGPFRIGPGPAATAPETAEIGADRITLVSRVRPADGIRVRRVISLDGKEPVLTIRTTYEKLRGPQVRVAIRTVTQLEAPREAIARVPSRSRFANGYANLGNAPPYGLTRGKDFVSVRRDPGRATKVCFDGDALLWLGARVNLQIDRIADDATGEFPDGGCHTAIATYPDTGPDTDRLKYVEFETLSPLRAMKVGDTMTAVTRYSLAHAELRP